MSCITVKSADQVVDGLHCCTINNCGCCPYRDKNGCYDVLKRDAIGTIRAYYRTLTEERSTNEKNVSELCKAKMEIEYRMDEAKSLDRKIKELEERNGELKENNARLAEQNKQLLAKELLHHREWERLVRSQPMILQTEPVKIEPVSCDFAKMAKAANKAAKSLDEAVRSMEKLNDLSTAVGLGVITNNNARRVIDDPTFRSPELEENFVCCGDVAQIDKHIHVITAYGNNCFTDQCGTNIRYSVVDKLYRVRSDYKLMLVWEKAK